MAKKFFLQFKKNWLEILVLVGCAIFTGGVTYATIANAVNNNQSKIIALDGRTTKLEEHVGQHDEQTATAIASLVKGQDDMAKEQDQMAREIHGIYNHLIAK